MLSKISQRKRLVLDDKMYTDKTKQGEKTAFKNDLGFGLQN